MGRRVARSLLRPERERVREGEGLGRARERERREDAADAVVHGGEGGVAGELGLRDLAIGADGEGHDQAAGGRGLGDQLLVAGAQRAGLPAPRARDDVLVERAGDLAVVADAARAAAAVGLEIEIAQRITGRARGAALRRAAAAAVGALAARSATGDLLLLLG